MASLGVANPNDPSMINFETTDVQCHLPYHVAFQVHVECLNNTIKHMVIDEGALTSIMSLYYWKGSPPLSQSTTMLKTFHGCSFRTHDIIPSLYVQLGGKSMSIKVEVVDAPLDYNIYWVRIGFIP